MDTMLTTPMFTSANGTTQDAVTVLAAEGDTWGIPGSTFVVLYIVLILAALIAAMLARREIRASLFAPFGDALRA